MASIEVNGTEHEVTVDEWGIRYVDGMTVDNFVQSLSEDDMIWAAEHGMRLYSDNPEHVQDIVQRYEISD